MKNLHIMKNLWNPEKLNEKCIIIILNGKKKANKLLRKSDTYVSRIITKWTTNLSN